MKVVNPLTGNVLCSASTYTEAYDYAKQHANQLGTSMEIHPEAPSTEVPGLANEVEITVVEPDDAAVSVGHRWGTDSRGYPLPAPEWYSVDADEMK